MNAAIGTALAVAFITALRKSQKTRSTRYPSYAVNRPQIMSKYPLRYIVINDGVGGVAVGINKIFPMSKFIGFTPMENSLSKAMDAQRKARTNIAFVNPMNTDWTYPNQIVSYNETLSTQFIYFRLNLKKSGTNPIFTKAQYQDWKDSDNFKKFLKIIGVAKPKDFVIEIDKFSGFKMDRDLDEVVQKIISASNGRIPQNKIHINILDSCLVSGQKNEKVYITSFPLVLNPYMLIESFVSNLDPIQEIARTYQPSKKHLEYMLKGKVPAFKKSSHSDTGEEGMYQPCAKKLAANPLSEPYLLLDRRSGEPLLRSFTLEELERLAGFPSGYLKNRDGQNPGKILAKSTNPLIVEFLMSNLALSKQLFQPELVEQ